MNDFHVSVGHAVSFTKTVSETDVYLFAGITGDFAPNHVDKSYMQRSNFGRRMAHGALLVGLMSTASSMAIAHCRDNESETPVSAGYDRIRFIKPVFLGDTVTVRYEVVSVNLDRRRSISKIEATNQDGTLVGVASHILQWVPNA